MSDDHLTAEHLQAYLDGAIDNSALIERHLDVCAGCRRELEEYKQLYSVIENEPSPELSPSFADTVMSRLPEAAEISEAETFAGRFRLRDSFVFLIAVAAVIVAGVYFIDFSSIAAPLSDAAATGPDFSDNRFLNMLISEIALFDFNVSIVTFAILTLLGIGAIDKILRRRRRHGKTISYLV